MGDDLKSILAERNDAFERGDISWAAKMLPNASSPRVVEMAFHKARLECVAVSDRVRLESQAWLADRGLTTALGDPVRRGDPLPT